MMKNGRKEMEPIAGLWFSKKQIPFPEAHLHF
jgi:hypothetical protein